MARQLNERAKQEDDQAEQAALSFLACELSDIATDLALRVNDRVTEHFADCALKPQFIADTRVYHDPAGFTPYDPWRR